jgi:hypothetical protein
LPEYPVPFCVIPFSRAAMILLLIAVGRRYPPRFFCQAGPA